MVIIDTLSFSFQISALRDITDHLRPGLYPLQPWPVMSEGSVSDLQELHRAAYEERFRFFVEKFFGMSLYPATGRGRLGYYDHCRITDDSGQIDLGYLAFGGNRGTAHVYLNGSACKRFFESKSEGQLHKFLVDALGVCRLNRLDLAYDDYSGVTDADNVIQAYDNDAFYSGRGVRPKITIIQSRTGSELSGSTVYVGSRQSQVYWRSYDKNLERGLQNPPTPWFRHEAELKRVSVDLLLDINAAFAGCNDYAKCLSGAEPVRVRDVVEKTSSTLDSQIRWGRRLIGKTLRSLIDFFDAPTALALLTAGERGRLHLTPGDISIYRAALQI